MQFAPQPPAATGAVTIATLNVWNFFDTVDDPHAADTVYTQAQYDARRTKLAAAIATDLGAPDVLALQEVENRRVLDDLLAMPQVAALGYRVVLGERADVRGIRNAVLYRAGRLELVSAHQPNPLTSLPPEQPGVAAPLLFSRPPIVTTFMRRDAAGAALGAAFTVIDNHFKSKLGGATHEPRRRAQGAFIGGLVDALRGADPLLPVLVVGDLNATWADGAYQNVARRSDGTTRMVDAVSQLDPADRYSFVYRGKGELLDHLMVTPELEGALEGVRMVRVGTTHDSFARRFDPSTTAGLTDHDAIVATVLLTRTGTARST